jgi:hypothetical protein
VRQAKAPAESALQPARVAPRRLEKPAPATALAPASEGSVGRVRPASEAWAKLAEPLVEGKGQRLTVYGITGRGKTTGVIDFLRYLEAKGLIDLVVIHDVKFRERQQYAGAVIHDARQIYTVEHVPAAYPATVVLRKRGLDHMPSVEEAARVVLESADQGLRSLLVVDEFARALDEDIPGGFRKGSVNRIACEGYGLGASLIAIKQLPQFMPSEVRAQSELVLFGMAGDGLTHLVDERVVTLDLAQKITRLARGQFVIKPAEGEADGVVYQVPAP